MIIQNPHDKFFKDVFSEKEKAEELIKTILPSPLIDIINWKSLKQEKDTFVDDMKEAYSDMLFSVKIYDNQPVKIYLLFEHKSYPDKNIHVQLLSYLARIYNKMKSLTPVIPLVFYHGKKKWNISEKFSDVFDLSNKNHELLIKYIPDFNYEISDLSQTIIEKLIISLTTKAILYTFKNIWDLEDKDKLDELIRLSRDLFYEESGIKIIQKLLLYIYSVKDINHMKVKESISRLISDDKGEVAMTTAERLDKQGFERGIEQGIEKGILKGKLEDVERMLLENIDIKLISKITGLPKDQIEKLKP